MNLQESIRRTLKEETKLPSFIRRRYSEEDIDGLIANVKYSIPRYGDDKHIDDVIYDEVREFMMYTLDLHGIHPDDWTGNEYFVQLSKFEKPLRDYVKSVILNTNLQESIRKVLREDISNRAQEKLNQVLKTQGVVSASKVVGGINNLVKKLGLDMDDLKTQEMLVKSFIYHADIEDVDILHLEINRDRPDKVRIKIHFNTNNPASNMESWLVRTLCDEMNRFFPFTIAASWEPAFAGRGVTVVLDSEQIVNGDDEEI